MNKLHKFPLNADDSPTDDDERRDTTDADEARAWAEAAMTRCAELERVLRQVVVWFDSPLDAGGAANDDDAQRDEILSEAMSLNRVIDRAIALLDGQQTAEDDATPTTATPLLTTSNSAPLLN